MDQLSEVRGNLDEATSQVEDWLVDGPVNASRAQVDDWRSQLNDEFASRQSELWSGAMAGALLVVEVFAGLILTLLLTFFFLKDGPTMSRWILGQLHGQARSDVEAIMQRSWGVVSSYIKGGAIDGLIEAAITLVGFLIIGVPLALPLSILTFFGAFLPFIGPILAGAVATGVAFAAAGPEAAVATALMYLAVQQIEDHLLQPLVMGRVVNLHPIVIILSVATFGVIGGIIGAFLAVPTVAIALTIADYFKNHRRAVVLLPSVHPPAELGPIIDPGSALA